MLKLVKPCNTNHTTYYNLAPFRVDNKYVYITHLFAYEEQWFIQLLQQHNYNLIFTHSLPNIPLNDDWWNIYDLYLSSFFADKWIRASDYKTNACIITKNDLAQFGIKDHKYFIKTTAFSPKLSSNIRPIYFRNNKQFYDDVIEYLYSCENSRCYKYKHISDIFIQNWIDEIDISRELRVFVRNKKICAISQQDKVEHVFMQYIANDHVNIYDKCDSLLKYVLEHSDIEYTSCILDIYIDNDMEPHLIEVNPSHVWTGAGCALFNWITDIPNNREFRIVG